MAYETIVAVYDTAAHAKAAVKALKAGGFADADISIIDGDRLADGKKAIAKGVQEAGFWQRLFGDDVHEHEAAVYHQTVDATSPASFTPSAIALADGYHCYLNCSHIE